MWGYLDLIKTFWNLAWFGGSQNLFKQVDTVIPSNLFSEKLQLSDKELSLAKNSFLDFNLDNLYNQVRIWLEVASGIFQSWNTVKSEIRTCGSRRSSNLSHSQIVPISDV